MANWESHCIADIITQISEHKFVLPVIQRPFVWSEEKMTLLFDTLLKGDSFGGIMAIKEESGREPLFNFRPFTQDGNFIPSQNVNQLRQTQYFIIDGQQRLQSFYIGLMGTVNGKSLYFDLYSDFEHEFEFKFEKNEDELPKKTRDNSERPIQEHFWLPVKVLFTRLKETNDEEQTAEEIISQYHITDDTQIKYINKNIKALYKETITSKAVGISTVYINKSRPIQDNRQRIVELFRRLNDGGAKLSGFDLVASILKGFEWEMESFLHHLLAEYSEMGLTQDNLIKLLFILQNNHKKEMASIEASDAQFAIENKERIQAALKASKDFLHCAKLSDYYKDGNRSFIPLFFIIYHLFHKKDLSNQELSNYFNNYETSNTDFPMMKKWVYHSLLNGVFRSRGAGWVPYKTGIRKLLEIIQNYQNQVFPCNELFNVYIQHPLTFTLNYTADNLDNLDSSMVFYLIYNQKKFHRINDIDHIMPKSILEAKGFSTDQINSIANYQLLDYNTNRGHKNNKPFAQWLSENVENQAEYLSLHCIPNNEEIWQENDFIKFSNSRADLMVQKITQNLA